MRKLNWEFILHNLRDVRQEIDSIITLAEEGAIDTVDFETKIGHAYHHLNFAWNIRNIPSDRASECGAEDFNEWSKYPHDLEVFRI